MGSGNNNRKKRDTTIIRIPKTSLSFETGMPSSGSTVADICKPSFEVRVTKNALTGKGVKVYLKKKDDVYLIEIGGKDIGKLNSKDSKMVSECTGMGIRYDGEIIIQDSNTYARFIRSIQ